MEPHTEKYNEATYNRPEGTRTLDAPVVRFSLPEYVRRILDEKAWQNTSRNAITLLHNGYMRIVLVAIKGGQEMCHAIDGALSIQVLAGRVNLETEEESFSMDEGDMAALQPGVKHYLYAEEQAVFVLTLAGNEAGEF